MNLVYWTGVSIPIKSFIKIYWIVLKTGAEGKSSKLCQYFCQLKFSNLKIVVTNSFFSDVMLEKEERKVLFQQIEPKKLVSMVIENNFLVSNCSEIQMVFFSIFN